MDRRIDHAEVRTMIEKCSADFAPGPGDDDEDDDVPDRGGDDDGNIEPDDDEGFIDDDDDDDDEPMQCKTPLAPSPRAGGLGHSAI
jgi:hypothetical protein